MTEKGYYVTIFVVTPLFCLLYSCLIESVTRKDKCPIIHFFQLAVASATLNIRLRLHLPEAATFAA